LIAQSEPVFNTNFFARISDDKPIPYEHLVIDDGQDFKSGWLETLMIAGAQDRTDWRGI